MNTKTNEKCQTTEKRIDGCGHFSTNKEVEFGSLLQTSERGMSEIF